MGVTLVVKMKLKFEELLDVFKILWKKMIKSSCIAEKKCDQSRKNLCQKIKD